MKFKPKRLHSEGFTLLEVMVALAIFSIGILGVAKLQLSATSGTSSSRGYTEASSLGQRQVEYLISLPYDNALLGDTNGDGTNQDVDNDGSDDDGGNFGLDNTAAGADQTVTVNTVYNLSWNVAVDEPASGTKKIRLIVQWQSSGFAVRQIVFDAVKVSM